MNIAIFTDAFFPQINGVVTSLMSIAENMTARGHNVYIIAPRYKRVDEFNHPHIKVKRLPSIPASFYDDFRWTTTFSFSTYKMLRKEKIDIVHFMTPLLVSYLGIKIGRMLKVPVVGTFHTFISNPSYYEHMFRGPVTITEDVAWHYANLYYNAADYVTAPTEKAVQIIKENNCTPPSKAISNGIDLSIFDNSKAEEFKAKYNLGQNVILFIGRIAHEKNLLQLMDAFIKVREQVKDAQLLCVGDGPQKEEFEQYAKEHAPEGSIIYTGAISHKELVKSGVFGVSSLFATASVTETQGITILEAQANGLITVGARAGGIIDLIEEGVNGFLVDPENIDEIVDRIVKVLTKEVDVEYMGKKAFEMTKPHHMDKVIDQWEELYQDLIDKKASGELPEKDHLHLRSILHIITEFKIDSKYYFRKFFKFGRKKTSTEV